MHEYHHLYNKTFVNIDLETLSTRFNGCIVSIGAVRATIADGVTDEFTINIDSKSSMSYGLHVDRNTLQWWKEQEPHVQKAWQANPVSLPDGLNAFVSWLGNCKSTLMISQGSVFEFSILRTSFEVAQVQQPWRFGKEIDLRTLGLFTNVDTSSGNTHIALEDARNQTQIFFNMFKEQK